MLCTGKWVKKIVPGGGVFDLADGRPQLFRKLPKNKNKTKQDMMHDIYVTLEYNT